MLKPATRSLILGDVLARPMHRQPLDLGDPARMTDRELEDDHTLLAAQVVNITRQLDDDREMMCGRGDAWRKRALGARRLHLAQIDKLEAEGRRRGLAFARVSHSAAVETTRGLNGAPLPAPEHYEALARKQAARDQQAKLEAARTAAAAARQAANQREEAERRAANIELARIRAERHAKMLEVQAAKRAAMDARTQRQERAFITAAQDLLGMAACREIWDRARVMVPDALWDDPVTSNARA